MALNEVVQQALDIVVGPRNIDVSMELHSFGETAQEARTHADGDNDKRIDESEREAYLADHAPDLISALTLTIDGKQHPLAVLYEPEAEGLEGEASSTAPLTIKLHCFTRTPKEMAAGSRVVLEDGLWKRNMVTPRIKVTGKDGVHVASERAPRRIEKDDASPEDGGLRIEFRIVSIQAAPEPAEAKEERG
ncbi:MAG: hypothetical protein KJ052_00210 [Candidatus Hydrogenedentes bacterium]|nr:hypothetical protein [Candidatus Hydrogenedentota bacterium]